jgi:hypothetical protein
MTALAQAPEVAFPVVAGIVIEMGGGQDHSGLPLLYRLHEVGPTGMTAAAIAPSKTRSVEPTAIGQAANPHAVRSTTSLTNASSALEPDPLADLSPISWIELSHFRSDWHQYPTAATPVPAVVATCASDAKSARKSWRHQHSLSSLESRGPEAAESSVQQHETLPLVAAGSIQVSLARAAVIENLFSPDSAANISPEMTGYPRAGVVRFTNRQALMAEKADSEGYAAARSFAMFTELASPTSRALLVRCSPSISFLL